MHSFETTIGQLCLTDALRRTAAGIEQVLRQVE